MAPRYAAAQQLFRHPLRFLLRAMRDFRRHQGLLLAGAVAYYNLLSIIPLFALLLVVLSHFMDQGMLLSTIAAQLDLLVPSRSAALTTEIEHFLENRDVVSWVGMGVLLFFSSLAFTVLENAMSLIFYHRVNIQRRHFLVSAIIPYLFILLLGLGILFVSVIAGLLQALDERSLVLLGLRWPLSGTSGIILYLLGFLGLVMMLTAFYLVLPVGRIPFRHALLGGVIAAALWESIRHVLVWYFSTLSLVNVVYGSFATAIVALLTLEVAAVILLFGAQLIAEFERLSIDPSLSDFPT
ncbi:MAG: YihY/virulence factor BrkB family protein [Gammaproteobacteria bacterium]